MPATPLTETIAVRVAPHEKRLLEYIAAQESEARQVDLTPSWVVRLLIDKHALSHLTPENQRRYQRERESAK